MAELGVTYNPEKTIWDLKIMSIQGSECHYLPEGIRETPRASCGLFIIGITLCFELSKRSAISSCCDVVNKSRKNIAIAKHIR